MKLIPKLLTAWTPLDFKAENSKEIQVSKRASGHKNSLNSPLTDRVHEGYKGDTFLAETDYIEQYPETPIETVRGYFHPEEVRLRYKHSEFAPVYFMGKDGKIDSFRIGTNNGALSGADPIAEFYVSSVALNPLFKGLGYLGKLGLAKVGNKWAQAKLFSEALDKSVANTVLQTPKYPLNFGWSPAETIPVVHYSKAPINKFNLFNSNLWGVLAEGQNPFGVWFTNKNMFGVPSYRKLLKAARARQTIQGRPYKYEGELELKKPMITVGDVPDRSALEYYAEKAGSDGIKFSGIYDNGMDATESIKSFVHPVNSNPMEIYKNRVISKGGKYETFPKFNLSSSRDRIKVADKIIKKHGLEKGKSYEDEMKSILELFENAGLDKIESAGMADPVKDYRFIHINPNRFKHKYGNADIRMLILHELDHMLHIPKEGVKNFIKSLTNQEYFTSDNGKEVAARVAQVLTNSGVSDARKFTGAEYKKMFEDYIHSNLMLNDMRSLYHSITDWEKFAKWANNPKNVFSTSILGGTSLLTTNKIENNN